MSRNKIIFAGIIVMALIAIPIIPANILKSPIGDALITEQLNLIQGKLTGFIKPLIGENLVEDTGHRKSVEVVVPLHMRGSAFTTLKSSYSQDMCEVSFTICYVYVKCGECHSIDGIEARWTITLINYMYFSHHSRDLTYKWQEASAPYYTLLEATDTGWYNSGNAPVKSRVKDYVAQINSGAVEVLAHVGYKCERWYDSNFITLEEGKHIDYEYYIMTPIDFDDLKAGDRINCSECGGKPPSRYHVISEDCPDVKIEFEIGDEFEVGDGSYWKWTPASFIFGFPSGKIVSFNASISAARRLINSPYLEIIVHSWGNKEHRYYYWFEGNDKHSFIVHMSWIPPS
jgi:hypothetical protein